MYFPRSLRLHKSLQRRPSRRETESSSMLCGGVFEAVFSSQQHSLQRSWLNIRTLRMFVRTYTADVLCVRTTAAKTGKASERANDEGKQLIVHEQLRPEESQPDSLRTLLSCVFYLYCSPPRRDGCRRTRDRIESPWDTTQTSTRAKKTLGFGASRKPGAEKLPKGLEQEEISVRIPALQEYRSPIAY